MESSRTWRVTDRDARPLPPPSVHHTRQTLLAEILKKLVSDTSKASLSRECTTVLKAVAGRAAPDHSR